MVCKPNKRGLHCLNIVFVPFSPRDLLSTKCEGSFNTLAQLYHCDKYELVLSINKFKLQLHIQCRFRLQHTTVVRPVGVCHEGENDNTDQSTKIRNGEKTLHYTTALMTHTLWNPCDNTPWEARIAKLYNRRWPHCTRNNVKQTIINCIFFPYLNWMTCGEKHTWPNCTSCGEKNAFTVVQSF